MKALAAVAVLALALLASADHELGEGVEHLTMSNLSLTGTGDWMLVMYAPWCGHCKKLLPLLPEIALKLKESGVRVGAIDADKYPGAGMRFSIPGFPMLCRTHNGAAYMQPYKLNRTVDAISEWAAAGWTKQKQVSGFKNPFGIAMKAWGAYTQLAFAASRKFEELAARLNMPPKKLAVLALSVMAAWVVGLLTLQIFLCRETGTNKNKNKKQQQKQQKQQQKQQQKAKKEQKKAAKKEEAEEEEEAEKPKAKKQSTRQKRKQAGNAQLAAQVIRRERLNDPIDHADAGSERVEEAVKKFKEEQKRNQRAARLEEEAERRKQEQKAQKHDQGKKKQRAQQNRPTQQPMKRS